MQKYIFFQLNIIHFFFQNVNVIEISKKINTYETSILPYEDCCTVFLPKFPVIKPNLKKVEALEKNLNVEELIDEAFKNIEKIIF